MLLEKRGNAGPEAGSCHQLGGFPRQLHATRSQRPWLLGEEGAIPSSCPPWVMAP